MNMKDDYLLYVWLPGERDSGQSLALQIQPLRCQLSLLNLHQTCTKAHNGLKTCEVCVV